MEQIEQLKTMRDAALERLQANPDYKLVTSLDALIVDLEASFAPAEVVADKAAPVEEEATPEIAEAVDSANLEDQVAKSLDADLAALGNADKADATVN